MTTRRRAAGLNRASLRARLDAINIEMDEVRRYERNEDRFSAAQDREVAMRDAAVADPVTSRLGDMFHISTDRVDLTVGLGFGALLESLACFGWIIALPRRIVATRAVVESHHGMLTSNRLQPQSTTGEALEPEAGRKGNEAVTASNRQTRSTDEPVSWVNAVPATSGSADLARLAAEIAAGRTRATVSDIRKHFRCSPQRAMALRKQFSAAMHEIAGTG